MSDDTVAGAQSRPIDATVAVGAIARGDLVVTSDDGDIRRLADALAAPIAIVHA